MRSHGQVKFTSLNPSRKIPDNLKVNIDFNADKISDIAILYNGYKSNPGCPAEIHSKIGFSATFDTLIIIENPSGGIIFNNLDSIQNLPFHTCYAKDAGYLCSNIVESISGCNWGPNYSGLRVAVNNQYFAVKFKINNQYHYGWIKFSKTEGVNIEIKSFAYHTEPNITFTINDPFPTSADKELMEEKIRILPNPFQDKIKVSSSEGEISNISIYNLLGQLIYSADNEGSEAVINASFMPKGTFIIKIKTGETILSRLIVK